MLKRSKSGGSRAEAVVDIFEGTFGGELSELAVPAAGSLSVAVALFEHSEDSFDDRSAVVHFVVEPGVVR